MLIYISGKITDNDSYYADFEQAEYWLRLKGHKVINIANVVTTLPMLSYEQYMQLDYKLIDIADCIFMLGGWQMSKGAKAELAYAKSIGKKILYQGYFGKRERRDNETRNSN